MNKEEMIEAMTRLLDEKDDLMLRVLNHAGWESTDLANRIRTAIKEELDG